MRIVVKPQESRVHFNAIIREEQPKFRETVSKEKLLGSAIAGYFDFTIEPVVETAYYSLVEVNAHDLAKQFADLAVKAGYNV